MKPGEELSLEYKFYPDPRLEPRDFIVALTAFYSDSKGEWHSTTFFNQTVDIVEVKKLIDWELFFLVVLFSAAIGGVGECFACESMLFFVHGLRMPALGNSAQLLNIMTLAVQHNSQGQHHTCQKSGSALKRRSK